MKRLAVTAKKLLIKEEELQELHTSLSRQLREEHITEVIRQNKDNKARLEKARELEADDCSILREMVVAPTGVCTNTSKGN